MTSRRFSTPLIALCACVHGAFAAAPELDDPAPLDGSGFPAKVEPRVPVGKALIFPITAADADGDVLEYSVTSSNPDVIPRVRAGLPKLVMNVSHAAGTGTAPDPEFSGTLEFALLRDFTPITADIIGGFAQGHFYDGQIFHRFANLDPAEQPDGSFIFQGGDPAGTGSGGPGFQFENEFKAPLIFSGRGQLAMANSGSNALTFRGSNGSQFFITDGQPRFLDFNHTIFAQLLRGWELLPQFRAVPRGAQDRPVQAVNLVSARVEPDFSDAILTIAAVAPGTATITVTITDGTSAPVAKSFTVTAFEDERNSPPFLQPIPPRVAARDAIFEVPLKAVDLERDFIFHQNRVIAGQGQSSGSGNPARAVGISGYTGLLTLGNSITEYDMTYRGTIDGPAAATEDMKPADAGVGDKALEAEAVSFAAAPGQVLSGQVVATFNDSDSRGTGSTTTATIRWGDGSTPATTTGIIARDTSRPGAARFTVAATHTYQNAGIYPVNVELQSSRGAKKTVRGQAVVTAGPLAAIGLGIEVKGKRLTSECVATFTDAAPGRPKDYRAEIAWGDGGVSEGTVKRDKTGGFKVLGSHKYIDPDDFAIAVRIRKNGDAAMQTVAWSRAEVSGFKAKPHLPPFSFSHLIGQFTQTAAGASNDFQPLRVTTGNETFITGELLVLNAGNKRSPAGSIQFFLSADTGLNRTPVQIDDPNNPGMTITTPADRPVTIGGEATGDLQALAPGQGIRFVFDRSTGEDRRLRLPRGENGSAFNLLAVLVYPDPLARKLPIDRAVVFGPFNGFKVKPKSLVVREADAAEMTKTFTVKMDRAPEADVTVNLTVSDATQLTLAPATLTFTPANFGTEQTVSVTATDDGAVDGIKSVRITLAPAISADPQWRGIDPDDVTVSVLDKIATP